MLIITRLLYHIYTKRNEQDFHLLGKSWHVNNFATVYRIIGMKISFSTIKQACSIYVEHDGGVYEGKNGVYSIIFFASNLPSNAVGGHQMGELGKYTLEYLDSTKQRS